MQWSSVSILLLAAWRAAGEPTYPVDVELDLIFPRPGGTYKRIYPFPVLYGIRNAAAIWPFQLDVTVLIEGGDNGINERAYLPPFEGAGGGKFQPHSVGDLPEDQDPFYAILPFEDVVNATTTETATFYWDFTVLENCTVPRVPRSSGRHAYTMKGNFTFNLSDDGELPDTVLSGDDCSVPLHAARLLDDDGCVVIDKNPVKTDPCQLRPTEALRKRVIEKMVSKAECKEGTLWPDKEIKGRCPWEEDKAKHLQGSLGGLAGVIAAVTASIFLQF